MAGVHSRQLNRRDACLFGVVFEKQRFRTITSWMKETRRQRSEEQEGERPRFPLVEKPRCQTSKSRVRSATLPSHLRNANRSITRNVT